MNKMKSDILRVMLSSSYEGQRTVAEKTGYSLGAVNRVLNELKQDSFLDSYMIPTSKSYEIYSKKKTKNAIILAAGVGSRMVPINTEIHKGLLTVNGEPLIERIIKQLHEAGVKDIFVVVGFLKEQFEYLIDKYNVRLVVNKDYTVKNNLHSLNLVAEKVGNTYIIPCDIWCRNNPFSNHEMYSWYMINDVLTGESDVCANRKGELVQARNQQQGNTMLGIAYISEEDRVRFKNDLSRMCADKKYNSAFWEDALFAEKNSKKSVRVIAKEVRSNEVIEINTYEQLRDLDNNSIQLQTQAMSLIRQVFDVNDKDITNITVLKKGMTNRSFLFEVNKKKYIMRIPGEGTDKLIDRQQEFSVYNTIKSTGLCDNIIYINSQNGYKITQYIEKTRTCDPNDVKDLKKCMKRLKDFHKMKLKVDHEFDLFDTIEYYESLWHGKASCYKDYISTKEKIMSLKKFIEAQQYEKALTHIDAVPDNFLFYCDENGEENIRLIDWEYAGMQDPHVDIAMFCIYSLYDREQIDRLIDIYFENDCSPSVRIKIYAYIAVCGLLWSNWCEYKSALGVEFGEYSLRQYRYAKDYYSIVISEIEKEGFANG